VIAAAPETARWVRDWAAQADVSCRESGTGWELPLADGRRLEVSARSGRFTARAPLPGPMRRWRRAELLCWQAGSLAVLAAEPETGAGLSLRATLPLEGLDAEHCRAVLRALDAAAPGPSPADPPAASARDLAAVRRWWEREYGSLGIRERGGELALRCRLPASPLPVELRARTGGTGVGLAIEILAGAFVEPAGSERLYRYLLSLNTWIAMGGFALAGDGSPILRVELPAPVSGAHVGHGVRSLLACRQRFADSVKTLAMGETVGSFWDRFNPERRGGEKE
jgi:hypothetical protein